MSAAGRLRWPSQLATAAALLTCAVAATVLAGSFFDLTEITEVIPGGSRMVPATAAAFLLAGIALWLTVTARLPIVSLTLAVLVSLAGVFRLAAGVFGWGTAIDFLGVVIRSHDGTPPGRMSPATALDFALLGAALILANRRRAPRAFEVLTTAGLLVGCLGLTRYVYGGEPLAPYSAMAIHTAALFVILAAGIGLCREDTGVVRLLTSEGVGGASARRLLPAAVVLPLALSVISLYAERANWRGTETSLAIFALLTVIAFATLVWFTALSLDRTDVQRRVAEDALRRSEESTRLVIDSALDAVIAIDRTGTVRGWNPQAERIFGWTRQEALDQTIADLIIPTRYREAHVNGLKRVLETGESRVLNQRLELVARHRLGHEFPIEIAITLIHTDSAISFSAFVRDITERRRAEDVLRESERRLRTLAESLPHLVWTFRPDGGCDYVSRQWLDYTGRSEPELLGHGWSGQLHPDDRDRVRMEWREATRRADLFDTEFRIRRADGVYRWFRSHAVPLRNDGGQVVKWFGSNTDTEDYKTSERTLRAQLERLALLDKTTRSIGERQDTRSILQIVLRSLEDDLPVDFACVLLRETPQHALAVACVGSKSQPLARQLAMSEPNPVDVDEDGLARCLRGHMVYEPDITRAEPAFPRRLASGGLGSLVIAPLMVESRVFGALVAARRGTGQFSSSECEFLRQLSEHVALALHQSELYSALRQAYEDLRHTQQTVVQQERLRALGQMAGGIAHDLNNALTSASLYVDSLLEFNSALNAEARQSLAVVQRAIADAANTVARMREFYRPRESAVAHRPVNLNELAGQVLELTRARWSDMPQERGAVIRVRTEFAVDLPPVLGADGEVRDALTNLVLNAVDAMPEGGLLTLRTSTVDDDRVCIEVTDTGVGMSEEVRARCLEPFFTTKGERGTGLGLAMVYGMLERHDADIQIESAPGQGTTIRLTFPAAKSAGPAATGVHAAIRPQQPLRILLVDDDPTVLKSLRDILERDGHSVTTADGGQSGIDAFRKSLDLGKPYSIVMTDLGMPHVDGRAVAAQVKAMAPKVPVVLLTGWGQRFLVQNDKPPFVDQVVGKPPKLSHLRRVLAELGGDA